MRDSTPDMPASEVSRPWTSGPWKASSHCLLNGRKNPFDSDLIALAPEMAEAILAHAEYLIGDGSGVSRRQVLTLADKLRAIGATDEHR